MIEMNKEEIETVGDEIGRVDNIELGFVNSPRQVSFKISNVFFKSPLSVCSISL